MSTVEDLSRRRGGREARRALRARPIPVEEAAVRPGMEGGHYKPLIAVATWSASTRRRSSCSRPSDLARRSPPASRRMTARGCTLGDDGRLRIPRGLVEDTLASCCPRASCCMAAIPSTTCEPSGNKVLFRHCRGGGPHRRAGDTRLPRVAAGRSLRCGAHRRLLRAYPFLSAPAHGARHDHRARPRHQHALCLPCRHLQACRHQHGRGRPCR